LLGGYKVGAAVLSQQQVASAPSASRPATAPELRPGDPEVASVPSASRPATAPELRPGDPGYRETRPGFNSKGEYIWPADPAAPRPASEPRRFKATERPKGLGPHYGWDPVRKQAFYEARTGNVFFNWNGE